MNYKMLVFLEVNEMLLILRKVAEYFTSGHNFRFYTKTFTAGTHFSGYSQPYQFAHFRSLH